MVISTGPCVAFPVVSANNLATETPGPKEICSKRGSIVVLEKGRAREEDEEGEVLAFHHGASASFWAGRNFVVLSAEHGNSRTRRQHTTPTEYWLHVRLAEKAD